MFNCKKLARISLLGAYLVLSHLSNAQLTNMGQPSIDITNIIPKSPQAEQLTKINELTINGSRGVPEISFNLYTATVGELKIPISINYDASGIKVDDVPSAVGLKWTLIAGGEISRSINGRPDEIIGGYFSNASQYTSSYFSSLNYFNVNVQDMLKNISNNNIDISHDQYSYNYLDKSGYFFYKNNNFIDCKNPNTVRILTNNFNSLNGINITDDKGNKVFFGGAQEITTATYGGDGYDVPSIPSDGITAWKMNSLQTYSGEQATFEYNSFNYSVYKIIAQSFTKKHPLVRDMDYYNCNCSDNVSKFNYSSSLNNYITSVISAIHTPNEDIYFFYSNNGLSLYSKQLDSITVKEKSGQSIIKRIHFHYGYYNGANLLKLNDVWSMSTSTNDSVLIAAIHYNSSQLPGINSFSRDYYNYYNGALNSKLISTNDTDYTSFYASADRTVNENYINIGNIDTLYYPTGGKTCFYFSSNQMNNIVGPGVKVDSIVYRDNDNTISSRWQYTYNNPCNGYYKHSNYVNNISSPADNSGTVCVVKNINSEIDLGVLQSPFYYNEVELRKLSYVNNSNSAQLSKEMYDKFIDAYMIWRPILTKKIIFRNNNILDTVKVYNYTYSYASNESSSVDWLKPGAYYFPPKFYYLYDNYANPIGVENTYLCNTLYSNVSSYGSITPRTTLLTKQEIKEFNSDNNQSILNQTVTTTYNINWQKISDTKTNSKGIIDSTYYTYLYSNGGGITSSVVNSNLYGLINQINIFNSGSQVEQSRINFNIQANGLILPDIFYLKHGSNAEFIDKIATVYDNNGTLVEFTSRGGFYTSIFRDYNNSFVIAQVEGAKFIESSYTSFEADGKGNWDYAAGGVVSNNGVTGNKSFNLNGNNIQRTGLNSGVTYTVTYWLKNGSGTCSLGGTALMNKNGWTLYETNVSLTTTLTISGTGIIDELRLYSKGANMTTFTYQPLIGISSQCDINNRITYYEYDGFNRLKLVRDQDNNILKKYCYNYMGQAEDCMVYYKNVIKSGSFQKNNCVSGGTGSWVTYSVAAGTYSSTISQADADTKAQNDVNNNGQAYANANGSCTLSCNCYYEYQKCINNICETGVKIYTFYSINGNGRYTCVYHYEWSDGSWSRDYFETSYSNCSEGFQEQSYQSPVHNKSMIDKKSLNDLSVVKPKHQLMRLQESNDFLWTNTHKNHSLK